MDTHKNSCDCDLFGSLLTTLNANEQRYQSLFNMNTDAIFSVDTEGLFTASNEACALLSGYSTSELRGVSFTTLLEFDSIATVTETFKRALGGESLSFETQFKDKQGCLLDIYVTFIPILVNGTVEGVYGIVKDVTSFKESQRNLEESEHRYRKLVDVFPDAILIYDADEILFANEKCLTLLGASSLSELRENPVSRFFDLSSEPNTCDSNMQYHLTDFNIEPLKGLSKIAEGTSILFPDRGRDSRLLTFRDISERKRAESFLNETLRENNMFRAVVEHTTSGIFITDPSKADNPVIFVNPAFSLLTGYDAEDILGKDFKIVQGDLKDRKTLFKIARAIERRRSVLVEVRNRKKSGEYYWSELHINPVFDDFGRVVHFVGFIKDITSRKEIEQRVNADLELAKKIQMGILSAPISEDSIKISATYKASQKLSGDIYYWFQLPDGRYFIVLLDVMGHGIPASLTTMSAYAILKSVTKTSNDLRKIVQDLNYWVYSLFKDSSYPFTPFITAFCAIIDPCSRTISYVNAGHTPGLFYERSKKAEVIELTKGSVPLGIVPQLDPEPSTFSYLNSSMLLLYTDGLLQAVSRDPRDALEKVKSLLQSNCIGRGCLPDSCLGSSCRLTDSIASIGRLKNADDDICLVSIKLK